MSNYDSVAIGSLLTSCVILVVAIGYVFRRVFRIRCGCISCEQQVSSNGEPGVTPMAMLSNIVQAANDLKHGTIPVSARDDQLPAKNISNTNIKEPDVEMGPIQQGVP